MRKTSLVFPLYMTMALVFFTSCQKEGSEGPAGPAGPAGSAGPTGAAGATGATGTANVIYSEWLDVEFEANLNVDGDTTGYSAELDVPKLTNDILATGEMKTYVNFGTADDPFIFGVPYFNGNIIINPVYSIGSIILISNADPSTFTDEGDKILQYRYVLIPGGVLAVKPNDVKLDTYAQVKKYLNLKD